MGSDIVNRPVSEQTRPPKCEGHGPYDAMVLSCIDPRIIDQVHYYMDVTSNLRCKYSQFTIAGAAVGAVAPRFRNWHETFWGEPVFLRRITQDQEGDCH